MNRTLSEWLSQAAAIVALATFALAYVAGDQLVVFLGVLGIAYFAVAAFFAWLSNVIGFRDSRSAAVKAILVTLLFAFFIWAGVTDPKVIPRWTFELHHFGAIQGFGIFTALLAVSLSGFYAVTNYRAKHKQCPDCAETVLSAAHVCRHCGFRWSEIEGSNNGKRNDRAAIPSTRGANPS